MTVTGIVYFYFFKERINLIKKYGDFSEDDVLHAKRMLEIFNEKREIPNEQNTQSLPPNEYYVNYSETLNNLQFSRNVNKKTKAFKLHQYCTIAGAICVFLFIFKLIAIKKF